MFPSWRHRVVYAAAATAAWSATGRVSARQRVSRAIFVYAAEQSPVPASHRSSVIVRRPSPFAIAPSAARHSPFRKSPRPFSTDERRTGDWGQIARGTIRLRNAATVVRPRTSRPTLDYARDGSWPRRATGTTSPTKVNVLSGIVYILPTCFLLSRITSPRSCLTNLSFSVAKLTDFLQNYQAPDKENRQQAKYAVQLANLAHREQVSTVFSCF